LTALLLSLVAWLTPAVDAEALRATAPSYLDSSSAREHLAAARIAGAAYRVDPDLLLTIAWRESRYIADASMREVSGRWSCGLMQITMPDGVPCPRADVLAGYLAGAEHLATWSRATHNLRDTLLGYAGGFALIRSCAAGSTARECSLPELQRAAWIRATRTRYHGAWRPAPRA
jgi:soluble lytic murein transglycosylase-like protein